MNPVTWSTLSSALDDAFRQAADADAAGPMARYMKDQFPFLGIPSTPRRAVQREVFAGLPAPTEVELAAACRELWELPEREFQYAACDLGARHVRVCGPEFIETLEALITSKSWWDTVDALASHCVGDLVLRHPQLTTTMDEWITSPNLWLARTALLHQLRYKGRTNEERLFAYCMRQAGHPDFFIRKAIGWALRQYSYVAPDAVAGFVAAYAHILSPLSRREALLALKRIDARRTED